MGFGHCHQRVRSVARSSGDAIAKRTFNSCIFTMLRCLRIMIDYWASGACLRKELSIPAPGLLSTGAISDPYVRAEDRRPLPRAWVGKQCFETSACFLGSPYSLHFAQFLEHGGRVRILRIDREGFFVVLGKSFQSSRVDLSALCGFIAVDSRRTKSVFRMYSVPCGLGVSRFTSFRRA